MQSDDLNKNIINLEPLFEKWHSFGWNVIEIDGHNFDQIKSGLASSSACKEKLQL
jgi:transketolase